METSAEFIEHTAEVQLRLRAPTLGELAGVAGRALAELELGRVPAAADGAWRQLTLRAKDREALLVHWLNELVYLAEAERWVAVEFAPDRVTETELRMRARGVTVDAAPSRVKAATFHGLRITTEPGGLEADVVLDV